MHKLINSLLLGSLLLINGCTSTTTMPAVSSNTIPPPLLDIPSGQVPLASKSRKTFRKLTFQNIRKAKPLVFYDNRGYVKRGLASWYQREEHGIKTASGQIYDLYGMTAAHASLPILSRVKVKNLRTGRTVVVTINDRLVDETVLIKLSYWAARRLKLVKHPHQKVKVIGIK